jgi:hypothetical protein
VFLTLYGVPWAFLDYDRKILLSIVPSYHKPTNQQLLPGFSRPEQYFNIHGLGLLAILSLSFEGDLLRYPSSAMARSLCEIFRKIGRCILKTLQKFSKRFSGKCHCSLSDVSICYAWSRPMLQSHVCRFPSLIPKHLTAFGWILLQMPARNIVGLVIVDIIAWGL